jgi:hypothetical protein
MKLIDLNRDGGIGANSLFVQLGDLKILVDCGPAPEEGRPQGDPRLHPAAGQESRPGHHHALPPRPHRQPALTPAGAPGRPGHHDQPSHMLIERMLHNSASVMERQREDNIPDYPLFTHEEIDRLRRRLTPLPYGHAKRFQGRPRRDRDHLSPGGPRRGRRRRRDHVTSTGSCSSRATSSSRTSGRCPAPSSNPDHFDTLVTETTRGTTGARPRRPAGAGGARLVASSTTRSSGRLVAHPDLRARPHAGDPLDRARRAQIRPARRLPDLRLGLGMDLVDYFDEICRKTHHIQFNRGIVKELKIRPLPRVLKPGEDPKQNALYIISSGMLVERTPSYTLASGLIGHAGNTIGFVGYCDPETPGGRLLASKPGETFLFETAHVKTKIKARVERFELSGHADREELLQFAVQTGARSIVLTHGDPDARAWFAEQLAAKLPAAKVIDPVPLKQYQV